VEGATLYSVGVSSHNGSQEAGRQAAYESGKREISNFAQITDLSGLTIETQMTFEEQNPDGTFNTYRLLKVEIADLTKWKENQMARARAELEKQTTAVAEEVKRKEVQLKALQEQQATLSDLDARAAQLQRHLKTVSDQVRRRIRCGMSKNEVLGLLGPPKARDRTSEIFGIQEDENILGHAYWNYAELWLYFEHGILVGVADYPTTASMRGCKFILGH